MNPIRSLHGRARNAWRASLLAGLACAGAVLVAACSAGSAAAPPTVTVTVAPPPSSATPPPTAAPTPPAPEAATLPAYQPSRVVSSGAGSAYLISPDPVGKVS